MTPYGTRRNFFNWTRGALAAAGIWGAAPASGENPPMHQTGVDYYDKLGVTKIINAAGTYTMFTACLLYTSPSPRDGLLSRMPSSA